MINICKKPTEEQNFNFIYDDNLTIEEKRERFKGVLEKIF